jgi:hypothetical protein
MPRPALPSRPHWPAPLKTARIAAAMVLAGGGALMAAQATPLEFTLVNPSTTLQSRLELTATANLAGGQLTSAPQFAPGGLNGAGSQSTLYNATGGNGSRLAADVTQQSILFQDSGGAIARNATGSFGTNLAIAPGVAGASGTAPASYGVTFSSPQNIEIPPIDLEPIGIPLVLNLGTLTSIDAKVALRGVVVDVTSTGAIPLSAYSATPNQTFDASALQVSLSGTADVLLGATARQANFVDYLAAGLALTTLQAALAEQGVTLTIVNNGFLQLSYTIGFGLSTPLPEAPLANLDASFGTLAQVGSNLRLTVPVSFAVAPATPIDFLFSAEYGLSGTLIGQVPFVVVEVPEPGTWALMGLGVLALGWRARRRSRG